MVGQDAAPTLPWIEPVLRRTLHSLRAHALLLHGPQGVGQFELALTIAQAWLCEAAGSDPKPCDVCASCHLVRAHSHPDLLVLVPEALQSALGWGSVDDDETSERAAKAKPSKDIKVEAVRAAVTFAQTTSARGRLKVVVLHPAERMNAISSNTLLKTLEEPPGAARFLLSCAAPDALLPTIRSRCQSVAMALPPFQQALDWLAHHGVSDAAVILAGAGGQPLQALEWFRQGIDAAFWIRLPSLVRQGHAAAFATWQLPLVIEALQKLCHDVACLSAGAAPRYFPPSCIGPVGDVQALSDWMRELGRVARHDEHPWNAGLMVESLVLQGQRALAAPIRNSGPKRTTSVHSRA
jgi:DNA polymerase-3 subunit delta'